MPEITTLRMIPRCRSLIALPVPGIRYAETLGRDTEAKADFAGFEDGSKVSSWAKDAMQWAVAEGIIAGSEDGGKLYLVPRGEATRAQVATMLMRFVQNEE